MIVTEQARIKGGYVAYVRLRVGGSDSYFAECGCRAENDSQLEKT